MERKDTDVAWCAGFFDGEGHVGYYRGYPSRVSGMVSAQLSASVPQNSDNIEVLEHFQSIIGFGHIRGPYQGTKNPRHVVLYGVDEVQNLLIILKPYLQDKKTLAFQLALAGYWMHDSKATAEDHARSLRRAKKKGCPQCEAKWNGMFCFECGYM